MKMILTFLIILIVINTSSGQKINSGIYESDLKLSFDKQTKKLTGYFEGYSGWDEETQNPKFSCIFYIEGKLTSSKINILTFYPDDKSDDTISGILELINDSLIKVKLPEEHGGCWNVQHFADQPVSFKLKSRTNWIQIKYVTALKTFFYSEASENKRQKVYLVKNDFVCIEKVAGKWAYCTFYGKRLTKGWIKLTALN